MATGKKYYWIKLRQDFMTGDTIDFLMSQKDGANYVVLYQMLCLMVANTNGNLCKQVGEVLIPYDVDRIKRDCKYFDRDTVIVALELFKKLGLVYQSEDGIMQITHFDEMVGSTTDYAEQKKRQRLGVDNVHSVSTKMSIQSKSKELDKEIDIDKELVSKQPTLTELKNYISDKNLNVDPQRFFNYYSDKGWNKITDWKAAVEFWHRNERKSKSQFLQEQKAEYDMKELEKALLEKTIKEMGTDG
jgi:hypothetical protein